MQNMKAVLQDYVDELENAVELDLRGFTKNGGYPDIKRAIDRIEAVIIAMKS